jgi:hypothetical protein
MYLIVRVHRSNAWADTPDDAVIACTADLRRMMISRITRVQALTTQEGLAQRTQMASWDAHARSLHASALVPSADGDEEDGTPLLTIDGGDAEEVLDQEGMTVVPALAARAEDAWSATDCHRMEVTGDRVRWTCVWGDHVSLTTWDVPLRLFETLANVQETTNDTERRLITRTMMCVLVALLIGSGMAYAQHSYPTTEVPTAVPAYLAKVKTAAPEHIVHKATIIMMQEGKPHELQAGSNVWFR